MKSKLDKLSLEEIYLSGFSDWRYRGGDLQVRHREMPKGVVGDIKRGTADKVLNSIACVNIVFKEKEKMIGDEVADEEVKSAGPAEEQEETELLGSIASDEEEMD